MTPSDYPRRILLCVTGLSPQIVTETLYALLQKTRPPFPPTEIHLLTTVEGAERARLELLDPDSGHFQPLCADYGLDPAAIRFGPDTFHVIHDHSGPLSDIRSEADNSAAADTITAVVRDLTADPASAVHASIAGGRKTMGFFLGYALSLFGRPQDRLSHVLVSAPFESLPDFFYPPAKGRVLRISRLADKPIHTAAAEITLADIPFVRLRDCLEPALLTHAAGYSDTVRRTQRSLEPAQLTLDCHTRTAHCGAVALTLPPGEFALLAFLARRAQRGGPGVSRQRATTADLEEFLAIYSELPGAGAWNVDAVRCAGLTQEYLEQRVSRIGRALTEALGPVPARLYAIHTVGKRSMSHYVLALKPEQIEIVTAAEQR